MLDSIWSALRRVATSYVLFVVIGVVIGLTVAPLAYGAATGSDGTVAIVPIDGGIDGNTASAYTNMMQQARQNPDIDAVVVVSNSGGGSASASETMYLQTKRTAQQLPVVASVDGSAASGAYYAIAPSRTIYAKPASIVGSVGVLGTLPQELEPNDIVGTTGPNKLSGGDSREFFSVLESLRRAFVSAVYESRGDRIQLTPAELSQAQVYSGSQAVQNGLADEIGDRQAAIERAADEANLESYEVRTLRPDGQTFRFVSRNNYLASDAPNKEMVDFEYFSGAPGTGPTFLMMPGSYVSSSWELGTTGDVDANASASATESVDAAEVDRLRAASATPPVRAVTAGGSR
ncbi:S49 family peptidase [Salinigranum halophilum]|jgi:protease-4|uniref:S49 family peptidase n=1 Tax=Salinigranum halophilum TaxID=2565931 RepID=UPI0010A81A57|nr:S49 family peptidase [Salinigranum halophilum]